MNDLHLPWLEAAILLPLLGGLLVGGFRDFADARRFSVVVALATLAMTLGAWFDVVYLRTVDFANSWSFGERVWGAGVLAIDEFSAPLLALAALQYLMTILATLRTKAKRFSFATTLLSESILMATFASKAPAVIVGLLALGTVPPLVEIVRRGRSPIVYLVHNGLFVALLVVGQICVGRGDQTVSALGIVLLTAGVLLRSGVVPLHCWMTDLFEKASFGTALLTVTPMAGAYAAMRLVLPTAPNWVLGAIAGFSLVTAVYASCMALVQTEARRFFCYLFLSHASLVLLGVEIATPVGLTGALCVWLSVGLSLLGFGLTLRAVETRTGRLSIAEYNGFKQGLPVLAGFFLLTGLASIGFPGTIGFVAIDLLVEGAVRAYPLIGATVVLAAGLNGIAVLHAYFRIFGGKVHAGTIDLRCRPAEKAAVMVLSVLIIGGGLVPQPGVASRYRAAVALIDSRAKTLGLTSDDAPQGVTWAGKAAKLSRPLQHKRPARLPAM